MHEIWLYAVSVESFLRQQGEGGRDEGEGEFTLDAEGAWRKLGSFQLPEPGAWIVKIVQAAVLSHAKGIEVTQSRKNTRVLVRNVSDWSLHDLLAALFEMNAESGSTMEHLSVGIRALVTQTERRVLLRFPSGRTAEWNGSNLNDREMKPPTSDFSLEIDHEGMHGKATGLLGYFVGTSYSVEVSQQLDKRCYLSPIPVVVDGRVVTRRHQNLASLALPRTDGESREQLVDQAAFARETTVLGTLRASWRERAEKQWSTQHPFFKVSLSGPLIKAPLNPPGRLFWDYRLQENRSLSGYRWEELEACPSSVSWIRHGVVVESQELATTAAFGLELALHAEHLKTDLSGLQLTEDAAKKETLAGGVESAIQSLDRCTLTFERLFKPRDPWDWLKPKTDYSSPVAAWAIRLLFLTLALVAWPITIIITIWLFVQSLWDSGRKAMPDVGLTGQERFVEQSGVAAMAEILRRVSEEDAS